METARLYARAFTPAGVNPDWAPNAGRGVAERASTFDGRCQALLTAIQEALCCSTGEREAENSRMALTAAYALSRRLPQAAASIVPADLTFNGRLYIDSWRASEIWLTTDDGNRCQLELRDLKLERTLPLLRFATRADVSRYANELVLELHDHQFGRAEFMAAIRTTMSQSIGARDIPPFWVLHAFFAMQRLALARQHPSQLAQPPDLTQPLLGPDATEQT